MLNQISPTESIEVLINAGASINDQDGYGDTPLHRAAYWNCIDNVKALKEKGADSTIQNRRKQTPADQVREKIAQCYESIREREQEDKHQSIEPTQHDPGLRENN